LKNRSPAAAARIEALRRVLEEPLPYGRGSDGRVAGRIEDRSLALAARIEALRHVLEEPLPYGRGSD